jgi:hypothetical protein
MNPPPNMLSEQQRLLRHFGILCSSIGTAFDWRLDPDLYLECGSRSLFGIRIRIYIRNTYPDRHSPKRLDPDRHSPKRLDPDPHKVNSDPKH